MYKQVSAQFFENDTSATHRFVDDAMQYCLDVVNYEKGTIIGAPLLESFHDMSFGRYGTVIIIYVVDAQADNTPSDEGKTNFQRALENAFK